MTNITISESFEPQLSDKDLVEVEQQLRISLPLDYREFLLTHNGGRPEPNEFTMRENTRDAEGILEWLYGIHDDETYNLVDVASMLKDRMPPEMLPIGLDPGGNIICLA